MPPLPVAGVLHLTFTFAASVEQPKYPFTAALHQEQKDP